MNEATAIYGKGAINRLVEALSFEYLEPVDVDGCWADLRSVLEHRGHTDQAAWFEVLDLETAIAALKGENPQAALLVVARLHGFERDELRKLCRNRLHVPYDKLIGQSKAFLSAWLNGEDTEDFFVPKVRRRR